MASNMIHCAITKKMLECISVADTDRFLLGACLVPDASAHEDRSYDAAHCWDEISHQDRWGINWMWFYEENGSLLLKDDLYLGYYAHLIQDALWFHDMVDTRIRIYPKAEQKAFYQMGYRDYLRLNYLLQKEYRIGKLPENMDLSIPFPVIRYERMKDAFRLFQNRFDARPCKKEELELYSWDSIVKFIGDSAYLCIKEIEAIRKNEKGLDPEKLFVGQRS